MEEAVLLYKGACEVCGSSDARAVYSDGHSYCFACDPKDAWDKGTMESTTEQPRRHTMRNNVNLLEKSKCDGYFSAIPKRGLTIETCSKYDYWIGKDGNNIVQIANYYDDSGTIVGQKVRGANKEFKALGKMNSKLLFGSQLWNGGAKIVITEGEIDCMVVSQLQGNKYPVVSLSGGAAAAKKTCAANYDYLDQFEKIILMFDMDDAGRNAIEEAVTVLPAGKVYVATLPFKDPDECVRNGAAEAVQSQIWNAKRWAPSEVINPFDEIDNVADSIMSDANQAIPFMDFEGLNKALLGIHGGDVIMITSGSGMGKSTFTRQLLLWLNENCPAAYPAGLMLEESTKDTIIDLVGLSIKKRLRLMPEYLKENTENGNFKKWAEKIFGGSSRLRLYSGFAESNTDKIFSSMRYMVTVEGTNVIVFDHVSLVASASEDSNERKMLDKLMTDIKKFAKQYNVAIIPICHLKNPDKGKPYNEGRHVSITDLRGSGALYQLSDVVISLERNQQGDDPNRVNIRVLKNRLGSVTGVLDHALYNQETGWLEPLNDSNNDQPFDGHLDDEEDF